MFSKNFEKALIRSLHSNILKKIFSLESVVKNLTKISPISKIFTGMISLKSIKIENAICNIYITSGSLKPLILRNPSDFVSPFENYTIDLKFIVDLNLVLSTFENAIFSSKSTNLLFSINKNKIKIGTEILKFETTNKNNKILEKIDFKFDLKIIEKLNSFLKSCKNKKCILSICLCCHHKVLIFCIQFKSEFYYFSIVPN